jgi:uncharacterized protein YkwD
MGRVEFQPKRWMPLALSFAALLTLIAFSPLPANAAISRDSFEECLLDRTNEARAAEGIGELQMAHDLVPEVRDWSRWMRFNDFKHMPSERRYDILPSTWRTWGENIAMHGNDNMADCTPIHEMWMNSPGHRNNILNPSFRFAAMGTYVDGSGWWATQLFFDATDYGASCIGTFCDDDGSSFESSIERIAAAGITQGCNPPTNNRFCPNDRVTRGEMAAFLTRALGLTNTGNVDFADDNGSVFENDIERIAAAGITLGCNPPANTRFCPDDYVTRGQMAAFLTRGLALNSASDIDFVDDDHSPFESSIEQLAASGITLGCNPPANDRFCPDQYVTRGQMAAFLTRALDT